jgi:hypothetical protein
MLSFSSLFRSICPRIKGPISSPLSRLLLLFSSLSPPQLVHFLYSSISPLPLLVSLIPSPLFLFFSFYSYSPPSLLSSSFYPSSPHLFFFSLFPPPLLLFISSHPSSSSFSYICSLFLFFSSSARKMEMRRRMRGHRGQERARRGKEKDQ